MTGEASISHTIQVPRNLTCGDVQDVMRRLELVRDTVSMLTDKLAEQLANPMKAIMDYEVLTTPIGTNTLEIRVSVPLAEITR